MAELPLNWSKLIPDDPLGGYESQALKDGPPLTMADPGALAWAREIFAYEPATGLLLWKQKGETPWNPRERIATWRPPTRPGQGMVRIAHIRSPSAKMIWFLHTGEWLDRTPLHKDGDLSNDRIENLEPYKPREVKGRPAGSGRIRPLGVGRLYDRWQAYGKTVDGRRKYLGVYATEAEAVAARKAWDEGADLV